MCVEVLGANDGGGMNQMVVVVVLPGTLELRNMKRREHKTPAPEMTLGCFRPQNVHRNIHTHVGNDVQSARAGLLVSLSILFNAVVPCARY